jgi:hypothetical protein
MHLSLSAPSSWSAYALAFLLAQVAGGNGADSIWGDRETVAGLCTCTSAQQMMLDYGLVTILGSCTHFFSS